MKFAVTVESVFVEWSVDGCLLTFCFSSLRLCLVRKISSSRPDSPAWLSP